MGWFTSDHKAFKNYIMAIPDPVWTLAQTRDNGFVGLRVAINLFIQRVVTNTDSQRVADIGIYVIHDNNALDVDAPELDFVALLKATVAYLEPFRLQSAELLGEFHTKTATDDP